MKSKIIGKKQLLSITLVFAFLLAVFVNWYYTNQYSNPPKPDATENINLGEAQLVNSNSTNNQSNDYFSSAKLKKSKAHDDAIKHLEKIISDNKLDKDTIEVARKELTEISQIIKKETDIENIIKAQLTFDSVVILNTDSIEIILPKNTINKDLINRIKNIVLSKTNLTSDNIVIIEVK